MKLLLRALSILILVLYSSLAYAQVTVSGTVLDEEENPLIGATILIQGSSTGTVTDFDGLFSLEVNQGDVLLVSYTGYQNAEVVVTDALDYTVTMTQGLSLQEVVVTGYSVDSRRSTPGSVSTISASDLQAVPSGNVEQQLQGRVAGVTVITNGQPGTSSQVRVRGYGALGGNEPLYVVDGVPTNSTDFVQPEQIASTTVLKDATAASIYGARAAGGVIVMTTKNGGRNQPLRITYDGVVGVTNPGEGAPNMNPRDQATWTWNALRNAAQQAGETPSFSHPQYGSGDVPVLPEYLLVGSSPGAQIMGGVNLAEEAMRYNVDPSLGAVYQVIRANQAGTDWYDAITRNALLHRHNLGFSGGGERSAYYVGMGIQEQDGILNHQKFQRFNLRLNSSFDLLPKLRIGENIQITHQTNTFLLGDGGGSGSADDENVINMAARMPTIIPVYDEFGGYAGTTAPGFNNPLNPVALLDGLQNDRANTNGVFGNIYLEFEPIEKLTLRSSIGGTYFTRNIRGYAPPTYWNSENRTSFGYSQGSIEGKSWILTNTLNYKLQFDIHKFDILVGQEALNTGNIRTAFGSGINPFSTNTNYITLNTVNNRVVNGDYFAGVNFASYFGRLNYDLNDKYIVSFVVRRDGSSRFGSENKYGVFPAFSAAWRVSSESFMSQVGWLDDLKIRGGYGIMGNSNNVDPNNQFSLFGTSLGASTYDIGGTNSAAAEGFYRIRIGNPRAKWERAITANVGVDALLLNGKWDIGVEWWIKKTEDLLFQKPVTVQSGPDASAPFVNVGEMENRGVDFKIEHNNTKGDLGYRITLNGGFLKNEIVSLDEGIENLPGRSLNIRGITPVLNQVGQPLSAFFGYQVEGLFQNQTEVDAAATQEGAAPGRFRFADINGDGIINSEDRTVLGNPVADFTGGLTIKLDYKNFELEMYSFASIGNEIYNISRLFTDFYPLFPGAAISERVKDSWSTENTTAEIPIFENVSNFSTNTQSNSFYVEDGSYFRMQNITLAYSLPQQSLNKLGLTKMRFFVGGNNLFTITGYSGLDPSVGGAADTSFGIDLGNVPITRSWTFGTNIGF